MAQERDGAQSDSTQVDGEHVLSAAPPEVAEAPVGGPEVKAVMDAPGPPEGHRDRRFHAGAPERLDDDDLAARTEEERVDLGLDDYDPDDVPPATDTPPVVDRTDDPDYEDIATEVRRQVEAGELPSAGAPAPEFPPTRYSES